MSKKIALLSAAALGALAITASVVAPVSAQDKMMKSEKMSNEKTVTVGGAPMYPSKNIVENAVNSKDHTTLVAAVKAAGLVDTLAGKGPFTVFAPTNEAFGKLPAGTVDTLVKPENKKTLTKILTYHVVPGRLDAQEHLARDHERAQIERTALLVRNPVGIRLHQRFERFDEQVLRKFGHRQPLRRGLEPGRIRLRADQRDAAVVEPIRL